MTHIEGNFFESIFVCFVFDAHRREWRTYRTGRSISSRTWVGLSLILAVPPSASADGQNWLCGWARWWNIPNLSQLNPVHSPPGDGPPCTDYSSHWWCKSVRHLLCRKSASFRIMRSHFSSHSPFASRKSWHASDGEEGSPNQIGLSCKTLREISNLKVEKWLRKMRKFSCNTGPPGLYDTLGD